MNKFPTNLRRGAPLPVELYSDKRVCVSFEIPDQPEYIAATRALISDLGKWYFWEKEGYGSTRARDAAEYLRQIIHWSLCIMPCSDDNAQIRMMVYNMERNQVIRLNYQRVQVFNTGGATAVNSFVTNIFNGDPGDPIGNDALCAAADAYVKRILTDTLNKYKVGIGLTSVGVGILSWVFGPLAAVIGGVVIVIEAVTILQLETAMNDQQAVDAIVCKLRDRLVGVETTAANFSIAIDGITPDGANQTVIADVLKATKGYIENFVFFVDLLGNARMQAQQGAELPCPCDDGTWCYTWNFALTDGGFTFAQNGLGIFLGVHTPGVGWQQVPFGNTEHALNIHRLFTPNGCTITRTRAVFADSPSGYGVSMNKDIIALGYPGNLSAQFRLVQSPPGFVDVDNLDWQNPGAITIDMYNPAPRNLVSTLTSLTVWGTGSNPFGASNCE